MLRAIAPLLLAAAAPGCVDGRALVSVPAQSPQHLSLVGIYFSGDAGIVGSSGLAIARALAMRGVPVLAHGSLAIFGKRKNRAEIDAIIGKAVRDALERSGARRVVVIGRSFGADMIQTALPSLPADLRSRVEAVVLIVPSARVHFRADPIGLAYRRPPDSLGANTVNRITWAPLTCIYGVDEPDSLCPLVRLPGMRMVPLPGGHALRHDQAKLVSEVLQSIPTLR